MINMQKEFLIGADPEFCCLNGKKLVNGYHYIGNEDAAFGMDGGGIVFEARPNPSENPLEVVVNIQNIIQSQVLRQQKLANLNWCAGSVCRVSGYDEAEDGPNRSVYPLGGHIHFGVKGYPNLSSSSGSGDNYGSATSFLSQYVGACSVLIEKPKDARSRRRDYGGFMDYRPTLYGFEYRTPSSWLTSPYVSAAMLCLAKAAMHEYMYVSSANPKRVSGRDISLCSAALRRKFPDIWKEITHFQLYQEYKPYIDLIYFLVDNNLNWFPKCNFQTAWGVSDLKDLTKHKISLDLIWARYRANL